jgi:hypothetical protein
MSTKAVVSLRVPPFHHVHIHSRFTIFSDPKYGNCIVRHNFDKLSFVTLEVKLCEHKL